MRTPERVEVDSHKRGNPSRQFFASARRRKLLGGERAFSWRMDARRPVYITPARAVQRPLARLAVRFLGPGPLRLRMVKFVHDLDRAEPQVERARAA